MRDELRSLKNESKEKILKKIDFDKMDESTKKSINEFKDYLQQIKKKYDFKKIQEMVGSFSHLNVLVIGDTIIDEYCFVEPKGRAMKDPMLSVDYVSEECYAGGILAIANHVSNFVKEVKVITLLGEKLDGLEWIKTKVNPNVRLECFIKENSQTTRKRRFISQTRNEKLFKIEYLNDAPISPQLEAQLLEVLERELPKYDLVLVGDFGHGFLNDTLVRLIEQKAKYLAVNAQTNSANLGFNFVTRYNSPKYLTLDGIELRYAVGDKFSSEEIMIRKLHQYKKFDNFLVTLGRKGAAYFKEGIIYDCPALASKVTDIVGAGDAVFSITSLFAYAQGNEPSLLPFIANCVGAVKVTIMGNKKSVSREDLIAFIEKKYAGTENQDIEHYFNTVHTAMNTLDKKNISLFTQMLLDTYHKEGVIYVFGNGGSAATASHFCGDLVKGVSYGLQKRFKAICLNDNIPALMAIANDISYDDIFIEQLKNFLRKEDLVIGISGSGNSVNVVKALEHAKNFGARTIAVCGFKGGKIKGIADLSIHAEVNDMEISEDIHNLVITHCVKRMLTKELNNNQVGEVYLNRVS